MSRVVVKVGGGVEPAAAARPLLDLAAAGDDVCVVHGAGGRITAALVRRGLPVRFVEGRRVTSPAALAIVREELGAVNAELCAALGPRALGLAGDEVGLEARRVPGLGLVGDPVSSDPPAVVAALEEGRIPVVTPLARGPLNVNADEAAAALAVGLRATRLRFVTDVPGLLADDSPLPSIAADEADELLAEGLLEGGIVPKLRAAVLAARLGVRSEIGETAVLP